MEIKNICLNWEILGLKENGMGIGVIKIYYGMIKQKDKLISLIK